MTMSIECVCGTVIDGPDTDPGCRHCERMLIDMWVRELDDDRDD